MIPRIKNNFIQPTGSGDTWTLNIKPLPTKFDNYFIESCRAAEEIYDLKEGPLHVMYSGGADSEYALNVFLHMGMEITPVIVRLSSDFNKHDLDYAFKFCQRKNITPTIIDINFEEFVATGKLETISKLIKSSVVPRAATCYAMNFIDGSIICGDGDPHISKDIDTDIWYFDAAEHDYAVENFMKEKNIDGTNFFCGYTPEMVSAFLVDPCMRDLADNRIPGKLGNNSSKSIIYNRHSNFELVERPKFHGYEKIINHEIAKQLNLDLESDEPYKFKELEYNGHFQVKYYDLIRDLIS
jgi:hypothetical protein